MIKVLGGQKNPKQVWLRLTESHPEVVGKCDNLKFPGSGQRETPVAKDKEAAYYILGLLPGAVGRRYREHAAKVFTQFLENPGQLAADIAEHLTEEEAARLEARPDEHIYAINDCCMSFSGPQAPSIAAITSASPTSR